MRAVEVVGAKKPTDDNQCRRRQLLWVDLTTADTADVSSYVAAASLVVAAKNCCT